jgi:hypothetical protein
MAKARDEKGDVVRLTVALIAAAAAASLAACGSPSAHGKEAEAQAAVAALEEKVPLPDASRALRRYERYYAVSTDRIEAVYLSSRRGAGDIHLVRRDELPQPKDGGCSTVNIVFDRTSNRFQRVLCNELRLTQIEPVVGLPVTLAPRGERG